MAGCQHFGRSHARLHGLSTQFGSEANYMMMAAVNLALVQAMSTEISLLRWPDMLLLLGQFDCTTDCPADLNEDGIVAVGDLLILLGFLGRIADASTPYDVKSTAMLPNVCRCMTGVRHCACVAGGKVHPKALSHPLPSD